MKKNQIRFRSVCQSWMFLSLILALLVGSSCSKKIVPSNDDQDGTEEPTTPDNSFRITDLAVSAITDVQKNAAFKLMGKGYKAGDIIILTAQDGGTSVHRFPASRVEADHLMVDIPADFEEGRYRIEAQRENESLLLGHSYFNVVLRTDIANQTGKTIKGVVHENGVGVPNVVVSDGIDVAKTDQDGVYYLTSNKVTRYVYVSIPGNYEVKRNGNFPVFYKYLQGAPTVVETKDFELTAVANDDHILLALGDMHLANRNNDLTQFQNGFINDVNGLINSHAGSGKKVYGLTLGDMTWETYWYSLNFALPQYITQINKMNAPVFHVMGNHDNDPYFANDWLAENTYRQVLGPTYYSFNIGKIHYIVLDNTEYVNAGGAAGVVGNRNYNARLSDRQMQWLEKHLATVESATPIVLAMHIQLHNAPAVSGAVPGYRISNGEQIVSAFNRFEKVHILTGHTHVNYRVPRDERIMEHNLGAVCATWWWTGRDGMAGNHIAPDGSPGGYGVFDMTGKDIKWQYKAIGEDINYQFRSYDLNQVHVTAAEHAPNANATHQNMINSYAFGFNTSNKNNEVLINVWGYDPDWTVSVTENGIPLTVNRVTSGDPLFVISYNMKRLNANATPTFDGANSTHMFKTQASAPNSTLQISVTDRFGTTYTESMQRPKTFNYSMR